MNNIYKFTIFSMALIMAISPVSTKAKEKVDSSVSITQNNSCARAFGHIISTGFTKNHGEVDLNLWTNCFLPFGIAKKLGISSTTTIPTDTEKPVISEVDIQTRIHGATITWKTNERTSAKLYWSTSTPVNIAQANVVNNSAFTINHWATINGLKASTTYHFLIVAQDRSGNTQTSAESHFITNTPVLDNTAPVISDILISTGTTTANVSWKTNENATSTVYWSTITPLDIRATTTASSSSNVLTKNHLVSITGLSTSTTYSLKIEATDQNNNSSLSTLFTGTTH